MSKLTACVGGASDIPTQGVCISLRHPLHLGACADASPDSRACPQSPRIAIRGPRVPLRVCPWDPLNLLRARERVRGSADSRPRVLTHGQRSVGFGDDPEESGATHIRSKLAAACVFPVLHWGSHPDMENRFRLRTHPTTDPWCNTAKAQATGSRQTSESDVRKGHGSECHVDMS